MNQITAAYDQLEERLIQWAQSEPNIRAAAVIGSRARTDRPADEWSDLDLWIIAVDPALYLTGAGWLKNLGNPILTFVEPTFDGGMERRVLFEGGVDVDFAIDSFEKARQSLQNEDVADIIHRGIRIILDKDRKMEQLTAHVAEPSVSCPPTQPEFLNLVNDFWYHAVWTAKKLQRGELWVAKSCCDSYMKHLLRRMIEWHAQAANNWKRDIWHNGRFLEQWADPRAVEGLCDAYAHYDKDDVGHALLVTMGLFRWLATETADRLAYPYPVSDDAYVSELTKAFLTQK